jgi:hypothetical protein
MLRQHLLEIPTRVAGGMVRHLFWGAAHHDLTALVTAFWVANENYKQNGR